jgi:hypothetical protein
MPKLRMGAAVTAAKVTPRTNTCFRFMIVQIGREVANRCLSERMKWMCLRNTNSRNTNSRTQRWCFYGREGVYQIVWIARNPEDVRRKEDKPRRRQVPK